MLRVQAVDEDVVALVVAVADGFAMALAVGDAGALAVDCDADIAG
jgi:hypothetical protein